MPTVSPQPLPPAPSPKALWALLWRAVLFFPLGVFLSALPLVILMSGLMLTICTIGYALTHEWWTAAANLAGLPVVVVVWRFYVRWATPTPAPKNDHGGILL